jgi:hypothetical protein
MIPLFLATKEAGMRGLDERRDLSVTPHIARNTCDRTFAIDARTARHRVMRSASRSASSPKNRSAGPRPSASSARSRLRGVALVIQVRLDDGRPQTDPVAQVVRFTRMTSTNSSKMQSVHIKLAITNRISPCPPAYRRASSRRILAAC